MDQAFFTTTGQLTISHGKLWEKRIVKQDPTYQYHSFILLSLFTIICIYDVAENKNYSRLLMLLPLAMWMYPHFKSIYHFLFQKIWRWYIPLDEIHSVQYNEQFNEFEETVRVQVRSGRYKTFVFRKSENQAVKLLSVLQEFSLAPNRV